MTLHLVPPTIHPLSQDDFAIDVTSIEFHRNGSSGEGFYVVTFTSDGESLSAVCFFEQDDSERFTNYDSPRVAVLRLADTSEKYRGDCFADQLLSAVQAWYDDRYGL